MINILAVFTIARATLRQKRGTLIAFAAATFLFTYIVVASYPAIGGAAAVESVVETFPPGLRRLLRIAPGLQAGFGLVNYLALSFFHPVFLGFGAAFVVGRATDALAGQIERGAIYHLLSRPIARWSLVLGKAFEMTLGAGIIALAGWLGTAAGVWSTNLPQAVPLDQYFLIALLAWALFAALGAGALVISSWGSRTGRVVGIGSAWALVSFVLDVLPAVADSQLGALNPWHHYDPQAVVATGTVLGIGVVVLIGWSIGATLIACVVWEHRDLA